LDLRTIESEEEAWLVLEQLARGKISDQEAMAYRIGEWAQLSLRVNGDRYRSSITPKLMHGLLSYHNGLARAIALTKYGKPDGRLLNDEDHHSLQLDFSIEGGSTRVKAKINRSLQTEISLGAGTALAIAIVVALAFCGAVAIKGYFDATAERHEIERERQRTEQSRQETLRLDILRKVLEQMHNYNLHLIDDIARSSYMAIIRSIPDAESVDISGVRLTRDDLDEILSGDLEHDDYPKTIAGSFTVRGLRNTFPQKYFLNLERGDVKIRAAYDPTLIDSATASKITNALQTKGTLRLHIRLVGRYRSQINGVVVSFD
jgi:hypothetical protein